MLNFGRAYQFIAKLWKGISDLSKFEREYIVKARDDILKYMSNVENEIICAPIPEIIIEINSIDVFNELPVAVKHTNVKYGVWYDIFTEYVDINTDKSKGYTLLDIFSFCNKLKIRCFGYNLKMERFITKKDNNIGRLVRSAIARCLAARC